jgi:hypothetical protein
MECAELLEQVRKGREEWEALIASVPPERLLEPVWTDGWSVKDIVGHVGFYENWAAEFVRTEHWANDDPLLHHPDTDTRNDAYYERNKDRLVEDVYAEEANIHQGMLAAINELSEDDFRNREQNGTPAADDARPISQIVLMNTSQHWADHARDIRDWL